MRRLGIFTAVWVLLLGGAIVAEAQPPSFTVTFGGEFRVIGYGWNNASDFADTTGGKFKDSHSRYFQRSRLVTTVESADKKAKAVWALEIGDITWGSGGGASDAEYGGTTSRVGPAQGGGLGADGVNVETKHLYLQFDIPFVPGTSLLLGAHNILFLSSPALPFVDDDATGVQFNWKVDPVDLLLWMAKAGENNLQDADDNDLYAARLGINITKDTRLTVEGLLVNEQCFARRAVPAGAAAGTQGTCVDADVDDTFWFGATFGTKIGTINLDATYVYGKRALYSAATDKNIEESGHGVQVTARIPVGPLSTWVHAWYTTGDENRIVGTSASSKVSPGTGQDFSTASASTKLNKDSDKLPISIKAKSWGGAPFVGEALFGHRTLGAPELGQSLYQDPTGTWGVGGSATYALTPALSAGGGVAFVGATEGNGVFGDHIVEVDAGALYAYNANLSFQLIASYLFPDDGDDAWAVGWRARFSF